jgi:O-antigen ligase
MCFTCLILDGFYQYFNGVNIFGYIKNEFTRVSSFFGDELILGSYLSRLWPIFFGLTIFFFKKENKFYIPLITIFVLSEVLIFLSGDRTAFFYINLSAVFVILFSKNLLKLRLLTLILSLSIILILSFINPTAKDRLIDKSLEQMNLNPQDKNLEKDIYIFSKQHTHHYISAYRMFLNNKIFGVGVKNFRNFCEDKIYNVSDLSCSTHPHNSYIQILAETGIIGFLILISTLIFYLKHIFIHLLNKLNNKNYFTDFEICILSGILIYFWPFIPTGNFFNNWLNIIMILNLPLLFWSIKRNKT